jgi:hypothetical protein
MHELGSSNFIGVVYNIECMLKTTRKKLQSISMHLMTTGHLKENC